jgi:hypothetical protein
MSFVSQPKYKVGEKVMVLGIYMNSVLQDIAGVVSKYMRTGKVEVCVNTVYLYLEESQLEGFEEYWNKKNNKV